MKKLKFDTSKLKLSKSTIASLSQPEMKEVIGGVTQLTDTCVTTYNCVNVSISCPCVVVSSPCTPPVSTTCPPPTSGTYCSVICA